MESYETYPAARLGKNGWKVHCPRVWDGQLCHGWVAMVGTLTQALGDEVRELGRFLCPLPGWVQDDAGVLRESRNAHRRRQRGYPAKFRTTPINGPAGPSEFTAGSRPLRYPAWAVCPHCNRMMFLDPAVLDVVAPLVDN